MTHAALIHLLTEPINPDDMKLRDDTATEMARCPRCKAPAGERCSAAWGPDTHNSRIKAAAKVAQRAWKDPR